jgi:hypothetical protein
MVVETDPQLDSKHPQYDAAAANKLAIDVRKYLGANAKHVTNIKIVSNCNDQIQGSGISGDLGGAFAQSGGRTARLSANDQRPSVESKSYRQPSERSCSAVLAMYPIRPDVGPSLLSRRSRFP